jgi:hypothetical protein
VHNTEADDVLSATRQREIEELIQVLRRFRPTRIAVEASVGNRVVGPRYDRYLAGEYTLARDETDQIALRLARELGLPTVHSVDEDGDFPYYRVLNYAKANDRKAEFDSLAAQTAERVRRENEFLRTHSVLEALRLMNADSTVARAMSEYYETYMPFGERYEYAGADLIASWFQRNIRIYHNIRALITSPAERILVVYGAGHLGWLRQMVAQDQGVTLRTLADLTR